MFGDDLKRELAVAPGDADVQIEFGQILVDLSNVYYCPERQAIVIVPEREDVEELMAKANGTWQGPRHADIE